MVYNRFNDKNRTIDGVFTAGDFFCPCGICRDQIIDPDKPKQYNCDRYKNRLPEIDTEKQIEDKLRQIEKDLYL